MGDPSCFGEIPAAAARRTTRRGDTKKRVLAYITEQSGPVSPAEVRAGLNSAGRPVGQSAVYNTISRLVEHGDLVKVGEGLYDLASRGNGAPGREEIGGTESLSTATDPHEGPNV